MKYIYLPIIKIIIVIIVILSIVEKVIYCVLSPLLWIFTTIDIEEFLDETSIVMWFTDNKFKPFLKKHGINILND